MVPSVGAYHHASAHICPSACNCTKQPTVADPECKTACHAPQYNLRGVGIAHFHPSLHSEIARSKIECTRMPKIDVIVHSVECQSAIGFTCISIGYQHGTRD